GDHGGDRGGRAAAKADPERWCRRGARRRVGAQAWDAARRSPDGGRVKVLITGGAGFLGSHLSEAWLERGDEVTVLDPAPDLKVRHLRPHPRFRVIRESVLKRDILEGLVAWADLVYHLAAVVGVEHYVGDPYQVLTIFMGQLLRGEPLTVIGDGLQTRTFTYVDDAVRATVEAGLRRGAEGRAINVGSEEEVSIRELAARMIKLSGSSSRLISVAK